ncbi:MAG: hypothetical protein IPP67_03720 [Rhodospirillaceae bacterium]|nr:hypothetical protein [Rhodospirillaceae bacterium]
MMPDLLVFDSNGAASVLDFAPFLKPVRTNIQDAIKEVDGLANPLTATAKMAVKDIVNQNPPLTANALASTILEEIYKYSDRRTAALAVEARVKISGTQNPVTVAAAQAFLGSPSGIATAILQNRISEVSVKSDLQKAAKKAVRGMVANNKETGAAAAIQAGAGWALHQVYESTFRDDFLQLVHNMPVSSQVQTIVGADPQLLSFDTTLTITDMQVHGDSDYVSVAGERDAEHVGEAGIFASKALFNEKGAIRAWTPWQRVMGRPEKVYGFDFDDETSNFWFVTEDSSQKINTVRVTEWGKGDNVLHSDTQTMNAPLSSVLDTVFANAGGLFGLFDFSPDTYGFKERNLQAVAPNQSQRYEQFGMMVATGQGRVALIESGIFANNVFAPTGPFY